MAEVIDLREFRRFPGDGVVAQVGHELVDVINISVAGLRLARPEASVVQRHMEFRLVPLGASGWDYQQAIPVCGHIVGDGPDHLRIAFSAVTVALAKIIGCYEGRGTIAAEFSFDPSEPAESPV